MLKPGDILATRMWMYTEAELTPGGLVTNIKGYVNGKVPHNRRLVYVLAVIRCTYELDLGGPRLAVFGLDAVSGDFGWFGINVNDVPSSLVYSCDSR